MPFALLVGGIGFQPTIWHGNTSRTTLTHGVSSLGGTAGQPSQPWGQDSSSSSCPYNTENITLLRDAFGRGDSRSFGSSYSQNFLKDSCGGTDIGTPASILPTFTQPIKPPEDDSEVVSNFGWNLCNPWPPTTPFRERSLWQTRWRRLSALGRQTAPSCSELPGTAEH